MHSIAVAPRARAAPRDRRSARPRSRASARRPRPRRAGCAGRARGPSCRPRRGRRRRRRACAQQRDVARVGLAPGRSSSSASVAIGAHRYPSSGPKAAKMSSGYPGGRAPARYIRVNGRCSRRPRSLRARSATPGAARGHVEHEVATGRRPRPPARPARAPPATSCATTGPMCAARSPSPPEAVADDARRAPSRTRPARAPARRPSGCAHERSAPKASGSRARMVSRSRASTRPRLRRPRRSPRRHLPAEAGEARRGHEPEALVDGLAAGRRVEARPPACPRHARAPRSRSGTRCPGRARPASTRIMHTQARRLP